MSTAIQISNLSKIYRLGEIGTGTLSRDLERWYKMNIKGQEDPFLKIGEANDHSKKGISDVVYSLRDINFKIKQGEALGIIGKNGAGKSTLLKIISRVTSPTTGRINIKGRVASLLEVGTGFHPELTGRENIYLNGAILGMRKKEITSKLDEIIEFSGVERYVDTPVKRYSSGMYVRLAFAVAAHLESEILIVDEVLAVGDAEFQKKCLGKMGEVSKGEGRTVLFVSHNLDAVKRLCKNSILLNKGSIIYDGNTTGALDEYLGLHTERLAAVYEPPFDKNLKAWLQRIEIINSEGVTSAEVKHHEQLTVKINYEIFHDLEKVLLCIFFLKDGQFYAISSEVDGDIDISNKLRNYKRGEYETTILIPAFALSPGLYDVEVSIQRPFDEHFVRCANITLQCTGETEAPNKLWNKVPVQTSIILSYKTKQLK